MTPQQLNLLRRHTPLIKVEKFVRESLDRDSDGFPWPSRRLEGGQKLIRQGQVGNHASRRPTGLAHRRAPILRDMPDFSWQRRLSLVSRGQPGLSPLAEDLRFGQE